MLREFRKMSPLLIKGVKNVKNPFTAVFDATKTKLNIATRTKISIATPGHPADFIRIKKSLLSNLHNHHCILCSKQEEHLIIQKHLDANLVCS